MIKTKSRKEFASMMERIAITPTSTEAAGRRLVIKSITSKKNSRGEIVSRFAFHEDRLSPKAQAVIETVRALIKSTVELAQNLDETDLEHVRLVLNEGWN